MGCGRTLVAVPPERDAGIQMPRVHKKLFQAQQLLAAAARTGASLEECAVLMLEQLIELTDASWATVPAPANILSDMHPESSLLAVTHSQTLCIILDAVMMSKGAASILLMPFLSLIRVMTLIVIGKQSTTCAAMSVARNECIV